MDILTKTHMVLQRKVNRVSCLLDSSGFVHRERFIYTEWDVIVKEKLQRQFVF